MEAKWDHSKHRTLWSSMTTFRLTWGSVLICHLHQNQTYLCSLQNGHLNKLSPLSLRPISLFLLLPHRVILSKEFLDVLSSFDPTLRSRVEASSDRMWNHIVCYYSPPRSIQWAPIVQCWWMDDGWLGCTAFSVKC